MDEFVFDAWISKGQLLVPNYLLSIRQALSLTVEECLFIATVLSKQSYKMMDIQIDTVAMQLGFSQEKVFQIIQSLLQKNYLAFFPYETQEGKKAERYSLDGLFTSIKLFEQQQKQQQQESGTKELVQAMEQEFGRAISPYEMQMIAGWMDEDKYDMQLIFAALKEAVLNQAFSLKYMDRILLTWKRKGITTLQQVVQDQKRYKEQKTTPIVPTKANKPLPKIPILNWLEQ